MKMLSSELSKFLSLRICSRNGIMLESFGPYKENILRMRLGSLNVDLMQCPGMRFV